MANIMDYLAWRGDIALDYSSFNDLDSLVLAELSYLNYPKEPALIRDLGVHVPAVDQLQAEACRQRQQRINERVANAAVEPVKRLAHIRHELKLKDEMVEEGKKIRVYLPVHQGYLMHQALFLLHLLLLGIHIRTSLMYQDLIHFEPQMMY